MSLSLRLFCSDYICVLKRAVLPLQVNYHTELAQHREWKYQTVWLHCSLWCAFFPLFLSAGLLSSLSAEKNLAFLSLAASWIFMLIQTHPSDWWHGLSEDSTRAPEAEHIKGTPWQESQFSKNLLHTKKKAPSQAKKPKRTNTQKTKLVGIYATHFLFSQFCFLFFPNFGKETAWLSILGHVLGFVVVFMSSLPASQANAWTCLHHLEQGIGVSVVPRLSNHLGMFNSNFLFLGKTEFQSNNDQFSDYFYDSVIEAITGP